MSPYQYIYCFQSFVVEKCYNYMFVILYTCEYIWDKFIKMELLKEYMPLNFSILTNCHSTRDSNNKQQCLFYTFTNAVT